MRLTHIDGLRGFLLISMTMGHIAFFIRTDLGPLTHHSEGFVDAAQGFVTLSGVVIGLVFGKRLLRRSAREMRKSLFIRMGLIWRWHLALLCAITALAIVLPQNPLALQTYQSETPVLALALGATLLSGPVFIDILPMYLVFMVFTPAALVAMERGHWLGVAAVSALAWGIAQTALPDIAFASIGERTGLSDSGVPLGLYFNRLGWQVLYFAGLAGGFLMAQERLSLQFLSRPLGTALALASLVPTAVFFALPKVIAHGGLGPEVNDALLAAFDRADMTLPRLLTFAAHFYLALWLLMAGRSCRMAWIRAISRGLDTIATWRPLVFLGQHSLPVYAWHVLLCYGLAIFAAEKVNEAAWYWREGVVVLATLTLFVPAILDARKPGAIARSRDAGPRPATAQS